MAKCLHGDMATSRSSAVVSGSTQICRKGESNLEEQAELKANPTIIDTTTSALQRRQ